MSPVFSIPRAGDMLLIKDKIMTDKKKKSNQKADKAAPDLSVPNGRDVTTGRFTADNKFAVNHIAKHSAILRSR